VLDPNDRAKMRNQREQNRTSMRILVLASDGFGGHGGIALYTRNVLTALCAHPSGPRVTALPRVAPLEHGALPAGLTWDLSGLGGKGKYVGNVGRAALRRCDLVICMHVHLLPLAYAIHLVHRVPLVLFIYGLEVWQPTPNPLTNRLIGKVDALVSIRAQTTRLLKAWANLNGVAEYALENAIHLDNYGVGAKNPKLVEKYGLAGKTVIMTMGRVEERYKGFDEVLDVLPRLADKVPNVAYVVAGGGHDVPRLQEKARALGVADRVVFTGFIADEEKADHFRLADVYAMPGTGPDFDRYPLRFVFLEAMACGVEVVGCRPEDEHEARLDGALLSAMVDPRDPDDIVRGILSALSNRKGQVPEGLARFGFFEFQRRLHSIVDDVIERG
jgi:phosphatidylinositol alpha-1,6-mannosyltransferase